MDLNRADRSIWIFSLKLYSDPQSDRDWQDYANQAFSCLGLTGQKSSPVEGCWLENLQYFTWLEICVTAVWGPHLGVLWSPAVKLNLLLHSQLGVIHTTLSLSLFMTDLSYQREHYTLIGAELQTVTNTPPHPGDVDTPWSSTNPWQYWTSWWDTVPVVVLFRAGARIL